MNKLLAVALAVILLPVLAGCETTRGIGKDLENTGDNIQETVDKNL